MLSDIEIARNANLKHISEIARELNTSEYLFPTATIRPRWTSTSSRNLKIALMGSLS